MLLRLGIDACGDVCEVEEISDYIDNKYISAVEAAWRLHGFPLHDRSHAVVRLPVHLPNQQRIYSHDDDRLEDVAERAPMSELLGWFEYNREHEDGRDLTYSQFPERYTWNKKDKVRDPLIACMITISSEMARHSSTKSMAANRTTWRLDLMFLHAPNFSCHNVAFVLMAVPVLGASCASEPSRMRPSPWPNTTVCPLFRSMRHHHPCSKTRPRRIRC